ncbi:hypothetical protein CDO52_00940 [Nocardiopsis gilva YIM 90087]|uniref:Uncharacterized protein n=1 Tax=Nocardiopsis gilva YIM 90087 TaxID=1235441 RepID=A0A223S092_9ACTN|nr:hypothetical protein [Nocardiopsis gilva]ASU81545.1 hypothetical protein CDO52_00940 [Nocardiopsis gilva YIM 90087]
MAFESQIRHAAAAGRRRREPRETDHTRAHHLLHIYEDGQSQQADAQDRADAAVMVRRIANRHNCAGECESPEHAADVAWALEIMNALGLTEPAPPTTPKPERPRPAPTPPPIRRTKKPSTIPESLKRAPAPPPPEPRAYDVAELAAMPEARLDGVLSAAKAKKTGGKQRPGRRKPIAHGTPRGYKQHYYRGEKPCDPCRAAELAYQRDRRMKKHKNTAEVGRGE